MACQCLASVEEPLEVRLAPRGSPALKSVDDPKQASGLGAKVARSMIGHLFLLAIEVSS